MLLTTASISARRSAAGIGFAREGGGGWHTIGQAFLEGSLETAGGLALELQYCLELADNEVGVYEADERVGVFAREGRRGSSGGHGVSSGRVWNGSGEDVLFGWNEKQSDKMELRVV